MIMLVAGVVLSIMGFRGPGAEFVLRLARGGVDRSDGGAGETVLLLSLATHGASVL